MEIVQETTTSSCRIGKSEELPSAIPSKHRRVRKRVGIKLLWKAVAGASREPRARIVPAIRHLRSLPAKGS